MNLDVNIRHRGFYDVICSVDKDKLQQVVMNVVSNAIKFSPKDKPVKVTAQLQRRNVVTKDVTLDDAVMTGCVVIINVEDSGPGIAKVAIICPFSVTS